ncbi:hypothetical protein DVA76_18490, partial [Acinetobacter baumannii]
VKIPSLGQNSFTEFLQARKTALCLHPLNLLQTTMKGSTKQVSTTKSLKIKLQKPTKFHFYIFYNSKSKSLFPKIQNNY